MGDYTKHNGSIGVNLDLKKYIYMYKMTKRLKEKWLNSDQSLSQPKKRSCSDSKEKGGKLPQFIEVHDGKSELLIL